MFILSLKRKFKLLILLLFLQQKYLGAEDPVLAKSSPTDGLVSMKRVSSIRIDPLINDTTSHVNEPNNPDYVNKLKKEKVKSMSKNWEQITESKSKNQPIKMINSFAFTSPTNICEKIEKFNSNNLIQLISKQPNNEAHKPKKNPYNCFTGLPISLLVPPWPSLASLCSLLGPKSPRKSP